MKAIRWPHQSLTKIAHEVIQFAAEHGVCVVTCHGMTIGLHAESDPFTHEETVGTYTEHVRIEHLHGDLLDAMRLGFDEAAQ